MDYIAVLARLGIPLQEKKRLARDLEKILDYMSRLQAVDTAGVPPTSHPLDLVDVARDDVPQPGLPRDAALGNAPDCEARAFFRVPAVLEDR